jgi:hypothetical protein
MPEEEQSDEDIYHSNSDNDSSSDSSLGNWYVSSYVHNVFYCHNELMCILTYNRLLWFTYYLL